MKVSLRVDLWETRTTTAVYLECYQINLTYATRVVYPFWNPSNIQSISLLNIPPPKYKPTRINFKNIMLTLFLCKWWIIVRVYAQSVLTGFYGLTTWNYGWIMFLRIMLVGWAVIPKYVVGRTVSSSKYTLKVVQVNELKKLCKIECTYIAQWAPLIPNGLHWAPVTLMDLHEASLTLKWPPEISTDPNDPNWVLLSPMKPPLKLIDLH